MKQAADQSRNHNSLLDGAIGMVKRFMSKPPQPLDLSRLLDELESVRAYMTEEESQESDEETGEPQGKQKGLAILMGAGKKSKGGMGK